MAIKGLTDFCETVNVPKPEYEDLIRESNTCRIIENLVESQKYVDAETIRNILGIEFVERKGE